MVEEVRRMTYGEIYEKAVSIIGCENVSDYRTVVYEGRLNGIFDFPCAVDVPNAIVIWLKNGDRIVYRAVEKE